MSEQRTESCKVWTNHVPSVVCGRPAKWVAYRGSIVAKPLPMCGIHARSFRAYNPTQSVYRLASR